MIKISDTKSIHDQKDGPIEGSQPRSSGIRRYETLNEKNLYQFGNGDEAI